MSSRSSTKASTTEGSDDDKGSTTPATSTEDLQLPSCHDTPLDVAIIGMACRAPGGINSPSSLWQFLLDKGDASDSMPPWRWEPYHHRHPWNASILARTTAMGYFRDDIDHFDAAFFSISPRESEQMDPQQRIALEVAWEALENAGISPSRLSGSNTSVYMGVNSDDYAKLVLEDLPNVGAHMGVGTAYCGVSSRISHVLDLMGPSVALDAACASSLVAVHHARQAIRAGETDLAIAGGVNALLGPGLTRVLDEAGAISVDGRCRSFDDAASGYGRGEGAGVVILKRLDKALDDGDHVLAVLKGSAVASDGRTLGIMAPNAQSQRLVAHKALKEANVSADSISYIEAHATSTSLGDPTETNALAEVYGVGSGRSPSDTCYIGSLKPNIGHLEAGAGVMGLIKAVLVLCNGQVPPQANLETLNRKIAWGENLLQPPRELATLPCPRRSHPLRAAVASYGYSGTVSHAIVEACAEEAQYAQRIPPIPTRDGPSPVLLLLSAPQATRIADAAGILKQWLCDNDTSISLETVSSTLSQRRAHHRFRHAVVAESTADAINTLDDLSKGVPNRWILSDTAGSEGTKGLVWVFSGHGAQWAEMGRELLQSRPAFADVVHNLEPIIQAELGFSALDALHAGFPDRADVVQAMTFLMHLGIAAVLEIEAGPPSAVVGHSLGEAAAAVVSGALSWREGALIVCRRARLYRELVGQGAMVLVRLSAEEARARIATDVGVFVAIEASPSSCVVAGAADAVKQLSDRWQGDGIEVLAVAADVPFHTPMLRDLVGPLLDALQGELHPRCPKRMLYSTSQLDPRSDVPRDAQYWVTNMVQPVRLEPTVAAIVNDGFAAFVEVSSHPIVTHSIAETITEHTKNRFLVTPTMVRRQPALKSILATVGRLHCFGCPVKSTELDPDAPWSSSVPGTLWHHQRFYRVVNRTASQLVAAHDPAANNLLGKRTALCGTDEVLYQTRLEDDNRPFPGRHPLHGSEIVPAAVLLRTFLQALAPRCIEQVSLQVPVVVSPAREIQVRHNTRTITIASRLEESSSCDDGSWLINTTAAVGRADTELDCSHIDLAGIQKRLPQRLSESFSIDYLASVGVPAMGFPWRVVHHVASDDEMLARVDANPNNMHGMNDFLTSVMDAATSIVSTIWHREPLLRMPTAVRRVVVANLATPREVYIHCAKAYSTTDYTADTTISTEDGTVLVEIQGMAFAGIEDETLSKKSASGLVHHIKWPPATLVEEPLEFTHIAFLTTDAADPRLRSYQCQIETVAVSTSVHETASDLPLALHPSLAVVYLPQATADGFDTATTSCQVLVSAVHAVLSSSSSSSTRLFVLISGNELGHSALSGLSRVIQTEHPDIWGSLIELEDPFSFPLMVMRYVQNVDVIRIQDGVPRTARLRPLPSSSCSSSSSPLLTFSSASTYLITGGLGALGLSITKWMVTQGARRLILLSRRSLPHRSTWLSNHSSNQTIQSIISLEHLGATVYCIPLDISLQTSAETLTSTLATLNLPPVAGVIHAAGVLHNQLIQHITPEAFTAVLAPKIQGALTLHTVFPPSSPHLDFFVLFSSCGHLLGFPGQGSYASANAFLDALARSRREAGDKNALSLLWTSWRGLGMGASANGALEAELYARGIKDITPDAAFRAWSAVAACSTDHGVVLRARELESDEPLPHAILSDIAMRKEKVVPRSSVDGHQDQVKKMKLAGKELESHLSGVVRQCVSRTLSIEQEEIRDAVALAEMGMDSVMTVSFRTMLQQELKVRPIGPTLLWKCPTVRHLVEYLMKELDG